jgi:MYXO-CTERM domain-containing protein
MDEDGCTSGCHFPREEAGCCSTSDDPTRPIVPVAMVGLAFLVMRRRRRRA